MTAPGQPLVESPWGAALALYFVLVGLASGVTLVAWLLRPPDARAARALDERAAWVALAALAACGLILVFDLGRPARFFLVLTTWSTASVMSVGAKLIALEAVLLGWHLVELRAGRHAEHAPTAADVRFAPPTLLLAVTSATLAVYPAVLLSRTWLAPLTTSPVTGLLFVNTSLLLGLVACAPSLSRVDVPAFARKLDGALVALVATQAALLALLFLSLHGVGGRAQHALRQLSAGLPGAAFWLLTCGVGLVLPLAWRASRRLRARVPLLPVCAAAAGAGMLRVLLFVVR